MRENPSSHLQRESAIQVLGEGVWMFLTASSQKSVFLEVRVICCQINHIKACWGSKQELVGIKIQRGRVLQWKEVQDFYFWKMKFAELGMRLEAGSRSWNVLVRLHTYFHVTLKQILYGILSKWKLQCRSLQKHKTLRPEMAVAYCLPWQQEATDFR